MLYDELSGRGVGTHDLETVPAGSNWPLDDLKVVPPDAGDDLAETDAPRSGATIVRTMVESLDGQISVVSASRGTLCTLDIGF